jgi:hypothetical protein
MIARLRPGDLSRRARWLMVMWLGVGAVVWLGVFDYVNTRGHKEYLYRNAELRLGIQPPPGKSADLREVMAAEGRIARIQATLWAAFIITAGWGTVLLLTRVRE